MCHRASQFHGDFDFGSSTHLEHVIGGECQVLPALTRAYADSEQSCGVSIDTIGLGAQNCGDHAHSGMGATSSMPTSGTHDTQPSATGMATVLSPEAAGSPYVSRQTSPTCTSACACACGLLYEPPAPSRPMKPYSPPKPPPPPQPKMTPPIDLKGLNPLAQFVQEVSRSTDAGANSARDSARGLKLSARAFAKGISQRLLPKRGFVRGISERWEQQAAVAQTYTPAKRTPSGYSGFDPLDLSEVSPERLGASPERVGPSSFERRRRLMEELLNA